MKKMFFALSMLLLVFSATAQQTTTATNDAFIPDSSSVSLTADQPDTSTQVVLCKKNDDVLNILREFAIPVVAITTVFSTILISIFLLLFFPWKKQRAKYRLMEKAIESGRDIPADFFQDHNVKRSSMESSFIIIGTGLGILVLAFCIKEEVLIGISAIVLFAGIGKLAAYLIEKKKKDSTTENE